ncbi:MAG: type II/IV secretion system protein [Phycisphaerae bacterium]|nr:type II/IV secretion system protein [Phycisphaerae bacterium]
MNATKSDSGAAVVQLVEGLLTRAVEQRASDVHFEPTDRSLLVRFRLDGLLHDIEELPKQIAENVIARLKVMAGLLTYRIDIPQEGALPTPHLAGKDDRAALDMRVATFPTIRGERAVVRVLYSGTGLNELEDLGFDPAMTDALRSAACRHAGMILVTGPAGAGKSTTLYAMARHVLTASPGRSIVALEDPVEQRVEGVTQIQIAPHGDLDYPRALRSILRQDPQVLLVGEVRDAHTASVIVEASLTGHLLLTTMHSGDPAEAVVRLLEMGIPPYQLVSMLSLVTSQRLVRTLCTACRRATDRSNEPYAHVGCEACHGTGYFGRTAIGQSFSMDASARAAVLDHASADALRELNAKQSPGLLDNAERLVRDGITDADEIRRVLGQSIT